MKLLHAVPTANGSLTFYLPKGQYGWLQLVFDVDMASGIDLTRALCGNVILNWNGNDIINVDAEILNLLDDIYGGVSEFTNVQGGASKMSVFIPCGEWFDNLNIYDVGDNDRVYLKLDFPSLALSANVDSGFVKIYAKNQVGVMNYLHNIIARPVVASGAATLADSYLINNIAQIYFKNPAALLNNIQLVRDNELVVDAPPSVLTAYSDFIHELETTNSTLAIDFIESRDIREALSSTIKYNFTFTGGGTLGMYFSFIEFTNAKALESQKKASEKIASTPIQVISPGGGTPNVNASIPQVVGVATAGAPGLGSTSQIAGRNVYLDNDTSQRGRYFILLNNSNLQQGSTTGRRYLSNSQFQSLQVS